jgi:hypothetical protein
MVQGITTVSRAVINEEMKDEDGRTVAEPQYYLLIEGLGLADVMGAPGVRGVATKSNNIAEVWNLWII